MNALVVCEVDGFLGGVLEQELGTPQVRALVLLVALEQSLRQSVLVGVERLLHHLHRQFLVLKGFLQLVLTQLILTIALSVAVGESGRG